MLKTILLFILCVCIYTVGEEKGKKDTTKLIKQYWEESNNVDEFWAKFTLLQKNNVGDQICNKYQQKIYKE